MCCITQRTVQRNGDFSFQISTTDTVEGTYFLTASVDPSASVQFTLVSDEPVRPQAGNVVVFAIPEVVAFTELLSLPTILNG